MHIYHTNGHTGVDKSSMNTSDLKVILSNNQQIPNVISFFQDVTSSDVLIFKRPINCGLRNSGSRLICWINASIQLICVTNLHPLFLAGTVYTCTMYVRNKIMIRGMYRCSRKLLNWKAHCVAIGYQNSQPAEAPTSRRFKSNCEYITVYKGCTQVIVHVHCVTANVEWWP